MKVLWSWLLELCDLDHQPTAEEGARALTRGGLEIEGMTNLGAGFSGVVVAEVVAQVLHRVLQWFPDRVGEVARVLAQLLPGALLHLGRR